MRRRATGRRASAAAVLLWLALGAAQGAEPPRDARRGRVATVTDGDTIVVTLPTGDERVRLLGIDAPELHDSDKLERDAARDGQSRQAIQVQGARARDALAQLVLGRSVALERDVEARDHYGRTLAWVWLGDGTLVNEALVAAGWARVWTHPPNVRHADRMRDAQQQARARRAGLWADDARGPSAAGGPDTPHEARHPPALSGGIAPSGRSCPPSHPIKGNVPGRPGAGCIYHLRGFEHFEATHPERCFATEADARAAGCRRAAR